MKTMPKFLNANPRDKKNSFMPALSTLLIIEILCLAAFPEAATSTTLPSQFAKLSRSTPSTDDISACRGTPHKAACQTLLRALNTNNNAFPKTSKELFDYSVHFTLSQAHSAVDQLAAVFASQTHQEIDDSTHLAGSGMRDCMELLDDTLHQLSNVANRKNNPTHTHDDVQTWLSAALTNQDTCKESLLENVKKNNLEKLGEIDSMATNLSQFISNSLTLYVSNYGRTGPGGRKLLRDQNNIINDFPSWVSLSERKLLEASIGEIEAHAVVARDGSGGFSGGEGKNVIFIKAGTYKENLKIPSNQKNVVLVGEGKGKTVIVGSKNVEDGSTTFDSATVGVMGDGFIAKDITIVNSAGPSKHQAVALRVGSDRAVIFRCSLDGYQDTLYTLSKRQFYRDTDISGTVDFIFGNSAVVLQNCNIFARGPKNFVTAQGRTSPDQNTGISIQNCKIEGEGVTYLGRPYKQYSRTVILQSFLDGSVDPAGWFPWVGGSSPSSIYYGEYMNSGPGSSTSDRVTWPGYHSSLTSTEAEKFTVSSFIGGMFGCPHRSCFRFWAGWLRLENGNYVR
ncbi:pectinesterase/pectinesterase inhibitor [Salix suchowensis]|nr:pectinesterase/pectinesterase inhibitor [Salix suchowensis]